MLAKAWTLAALFGLLGVALGAFGAHGLHTVLDDRALSLFQTAVRYQFYHVVALLMCGAFDRSGMNRRLLAFATASFSLGIILFCGSLYLLALTSRHGLGWVTPLGGAALIVGWLLLLVSALQGDASRKQDHQV